MEEEGLWVAPSRTRQGGDRRGVSAHHLLEHLWHGLSQRARGDPRSVSPLVVDVVYHCCAQGPAEELSGLSMFATGCDEKEVFQAGLWRGGPHETQVAPCKLVNIGAVSIVFHTVELLAP